MVMVIRTMLEDKLPDYKEFAQKTAHRLMPGIWR
jgi:hypothetical protein